MATRDLTPQLMKGEVWSVNGQRGAVTLPEPVNSLDSDSTTAPLAAAQGGALKAIAAGAVSTANEAKAGLDSKADKASNNFTTSLQLKGAGVATEAYVKTADVSNTKIDGKAIKTYIADAIEAGAGSSDGLVGTAKAINSVGLLVKGFKGNYAIKVGTNHTGLNFGGLHYSSKVYIRQGESAPGTWRALGALAETESESYEQHLACTLFVRVA